MGNSDLYVLVNSDLSISDATLDWPAPDPPRKESTIRAGEIESHQREEGITSTLEGSSNENQRQVGKKLVVFLSEEIGIGGNGTVVYEGSYENDQVAVKCIPVHLLKHADQEIKNFQAFDHHQNVVKFYGMENDSYYVYLALELCDYNLENLITISSPNLPDQYELVSNDAHCSTRSVTLGEDHSEPVKNILGDVKLWEENNGCLSPLLLKLMRDMVVGLSHLHKSGVVHRDLKPENVLIIQENSINLCAKLSDMDISRRLRDNKHSLSNHFSRSGTKGWKAKEYLLFGRQTPAMDLFSLGCLFFFCVTRGKHPFGDHDERDMNIKKNEAPNLPLVEAFPEAFHLIPLLLEGNYSLRPKASEVLLHPLFWDAKWRLSFLRDTSNTVRKDNDLFKELESIADKVLDTEWKMFGRTEVQKWNKRVDEKILKDILPSAKGDSVADLLQLIGNIQCHYEQLPKDTQILLGPLYEGVDRYFARRFPKLLIEVYKVVCTCGKEEECFRKYFAAP